MVLATNPVTGNRRILTRALTQQFVQSLQASQGNRRLPGALATTLGKLIQNTARLGQGAL